MPAMTGIVTPLRRGASDWATATGPALIAADILQALGTVQGELPWDTNRGSKLDRLRHKSMPLSVMNDLAEAWARECLAGELPQVAIRQVTVARSTGPDGQQSNLDITILYDVINLSTGIPSARDQQVTLTL
jgi:hypothetical protein